MNPKYLNLPTILFVGILLACTATPVHAKKKKKKSDENPAPGATPSAAAAPFQPSASPGEDLSRFLTAHLEEVVAPLNARGFTQPEAIVEMKESFADEMAEAPAVKKQVYQAAIDVCTMLSQAVDERGKTVARLSTSNTVAGNSTVGAIRKDHVGYYEAERENTEQKRREIQAKNTDSFFTEGQKSQWTTRSSQIRDSIQHYYARERELERQYNASAAASATAAQPAASTAQAQASGAVK